MLLLGKTAKHMRQTWGLNLTEADAQGLELMSGHQSIIERDIGAIKVSTLVHYTKFYGVDLYVFAWLRNEIEQALPDEAPEHVRKLERIMEAKLIAGRPKS